MYNSALQKFLVKAALLDTSMLLHVQHCICCTQGRRLVYITSSLTWELQSLGGQKDANLGTVETLMGVACKEVVETVTVGQKLKLLASSIPAKACLQLYLLSSHDLFFGS